MKKNELVHFHTLLVQVAENYVERGYATRDDFEAYHALGVTPMSLREPRTRHETAVWTLARILASISTDETRTPSPELSSP